jgi:KDO2-lipid IV(A) lauroyltransferase
MERIRDTFVLDRCDLLDNAVASGDGALMVVNHAGSWDHAGAWACLRYGGVTTVAERLKPEGLYQRFVRARTAIGVEILPTGEPDVVRTLARRLRSGRLVPLMGDRDISRSGVVVDLLGEPASFPAGPGLLALLTDAPVHAVTLWFDGPIARGRVHDRIEVPVEGDKQERVTTVIQRIADAFSEGIREHPVDWHMMQPVWLADLDPDRGVGARTSRDVATQGAAGQARSDTAEGTPA